MTSFYVYEHIRNDTGEVFYVGKGSGNRCFNKRGRNIYWHRIVKKSNGFCVKKLIENIDEEFAFLVEIERIDQLKKLGFKLSNLTSGGEGISGLVHTKEAKIKISKAHLGKPKGPMKESTKQKLSINKTGVSTGPMPEETKRKIQIANIGSRHSEESYARMAMKKRGKKLSEEHKKTLSILFSGKNNPNYGKKHSDSTKEKVRQARLNAKKIACPHCNKIGDPPNMARWHFNNCKHKGNENG
jgi:hypothetical protein